MPTPTPSPDELLVLTGSYTPDTGGSGAGLAAVRFAPGTGSLTDEPRVSPVPVSGASFLAAHPSLDVVYSTNEADTGAVSAVARGTDDALSPSEPRSAAVAPTRATSPSTPTGTGC
ncbi:beta-propeller fold lactonase family protein [Streptomyces sp. FXJ1.4098]|nr:beta-propeller fold lactonase family protein [Streptomyces sp. FXJ1.4098]